MGFDPRLSVLVVACFPFVYHPIRRRFSTKRAPAMRRTDAVHLALMLVAFGLTYLVPFELLLLSYVVLGPAHYFTEISWLHDRKYFLPHRNIAVGLAFVAVVVALIENASWSGFVLWAAFVACALFAATTTAAQGSLLLMVAVG
jgi:hypothetical protein